MGQAKRRGTFEHRKAQKLASQYGLTNEELAQAYLMNKKYNLMKLYGSKSFGMLHEISALLNNYPYYI